MTSGKSSAVGKPKKNNKNMKQFLTKNITGKPEEVIQNVVSSENQSTAVK